jgi:hypothetical protein
MKLPFIPSAAALIIMGSALSKWNASDIPLSRTEFLLLLIGIWGVVTVMCWSVDKS